MTTRSSRRARRHPSRSRLRRIIRMLNPHQILHAKVHANIINMMRIRPPMVMATRNHRRLPRAWQAYRRQLCFDRRILLLTNAEMAAWRAEIPQLQQRRLTTTHVPMRQRAAIIVMKTVHHVTAKCRARHQCDFQQRNAAKSEPATTRIHGD